MTGSDWIALCVGSYAAIVATIALIWNIRRERARLTVSVNVVRAFEENGALSDIIEVRVTNRGVNPVNVEEFGFWTPDRRKLVWPAYEVGLPVRLTTGEAKTFRFDTESIQKVKEVMEAGKVELGSAYVRDATERYYEARIPENVKQQFSL